MSCSVPPRAHRTSPLGTWDLGPGTWDLLSFSAAVSHPFHLEVRKTPYSILTLALCIHLYIVCLGMPVFVLDCPGGLQIEFGEELISLEAIHPSISKPYESYLGRQVGKDRYLPTFR